MSRKKLTGVVTSDKMEKTVVVKVGRVFHHATYGKRMVTSKNFKAHNELGAKRGQWVEIEECRPLSKEKHFAVVKILD